VDDFQGRHAGRNAADNDASYSAVRTDDKDRRFRDTTPLARIVDIPLPDQAPLCVTQDRKWQRELFPQDFRLFRRIRGNGDEFSTGRANFIVVVAVIRQLANTKRSPATAIEEQD